MNRQVNKVVHYTSDTLLDLRRLTKRIENPFAAERFFSQLERTINQLADFPYMGRARPEFGQDYRSFPVKNYIVVYRPVEDGIEIIRILHGAQDLAAIFRDDDAPE